jgi:hypothetical protein
MTRTAYGARSLPTGTKFWRMFDLSHVRFIK